ncbi:MAG TPA: hypothetical protein VHR39_09075 [Propionibacteriaceae bacterium]|nr:hypothetical protein [Propionibacteriaceae bacterium]
MGAASIAHVTSFRSAASAFAAWVVLIQTRPTARGARSCSCSVDRELVASVDTPVTTPFMFNPGGLSCGANPRGSPVTPGLRQPVQVHRVLHEVTIDVCGDLTEDPEAELRAHMARQ